MGKWEGGCEFTPGSDNAIIGYTKNDNILKLETAKKIWMFDFEHNDQIEEWNQFFHEINIFMQEEKQKLLDKENCSKRRDLITVLKEAPRLETKLELMKHAAWAVADMHILKKSIQDLQFFVQHNKVMLLRSKINDESQKFDANIKRTVGDIPPNASMDNFDARFDIHSLCSMLYKAIFNGEEFNEESLKTVKLPGELEDVEKNHLQTLLRLCIDLPKDDKLPPGWKKGKVFYRHVDPKSGEVKEQEESPMINSVCFLAKRCTEKSEIAYKYDDKAAQSAFEGYKKQYNDAAAAFAFADVIGSIVETLAQARRDKARRDKARRDKRQREFEAANLVVENTK